MLTRGLIIGKMVDDLANLKYQLETRNTLGFHDLSKICEDFIKEILNITYNYNLQNLNRTRSNEPGIDLGDIHNKIAYQITAQRTSQKVNDTLNAITKKQAEDYSDFHVFILGEKQTSYKLNKSLTKKYTFSAKINILDIDDLLRDIVLLNISDLDSLYLLFEREFRQVRIELEPVDKNGNYESSYYNLLEQKPSMPPKNGKLLIDRSERYYKKEFEELLQLYDTLASIPRITREILAIIVDKGKYETSSYFIQPASLSKFMKVPEDDLLADLNILEEAGLISINEGTIGERQAFFIEIDGELLNYMLNWCLDESISIRTVLNKMDFSVFDE